MRRYDPVKVLVWLVLLPLWAAFLCGGVYLLVR